MLNLKRLLREHVKDGMRVLEIGCAPGKMLAWVASTLGADVSGIDYSEQGLAHAQALFKALSLPGYLACEDVFKTSLEFGKFDIVYSFGLIEHFNDPREIVKQHVLLCKPGGKVLITIPAYGDLYGRLLGWFDPEALAIHNLDIMSPTALKTLVPPSLVKQSRSYRFGRLSPWIINFWRRWPRPVNACVCYLLNTVGLLQPFEIQGLCPMLVLEMRRLK